MFQLSLATSQAGDQLARLCIIGFQWNSYRLDQSGTRARDQTDFKPSSKLQLSRLDFLGWWVLSGPDLSSTTAIRKKPSLRLFVGIFCLQQPKKTLKNPQKYERYPATRILNSICFCKYSVFIYHVSQGLSSWWVRRTKCTLGSSSQRPHRP